MGPHETTQYEPRQARRGSASPAPILFLLLVVSTASSGGLYRELQQVRSRHDSDNAAILAFEGVRAFTEVADVSGLMEIPVGADSLVIAARVFAGTGSTGTWAVRVARVSPAGFALKSTGRLVREGKSMMCSVEGKLRVDAASTDRPRVGVENQPLCNGSRHKSAVASASTIGS